MDQENASHKGSSMHIKHDVFSDDEVSSIPWDGNAAADMNNASTGPFTHSNIKGQNVITKGFVIMSQGVNWLTNSCVNVLPG